MRADTTVVIPYHDSSATIGRALASVAAQTLPPERVIVVDDASSAAESAALDDHVARHREGGSHRSGVEVIRLPSNVGPGAARNRGWAEVTTRWVSFLDADDAWHPAKLEIEASVLRRYAPALLGSTFATSPDETPSWPVLAADPEVRLLRRRHFLLHNPFPTPTVTVRTELGPVFAEGVLCEDYAAWLRIIQGGRAVAIAAPLAMGFKRPYGESGLSAHLSSMARAEAAMFWTARREGVISAPELAVAELILAGRLVRRIVRSRAWNHE